MLSKAILCSVIVVLLLTLPVMAVQYTVTDLGTFGGTDSYAMAINNAGQVSGYAYRTGSTLREPFLYSGGVLHDLLAGSSTYISGNAGSINASGQNGGYANTDTTHRHALIYGNGTIQDLGTLGGVSGQFAAINASGQAVGYSNPTGSSRTHAMYYDGKGPLQDLGTLGGNESWADGINDSGVVCGYADITPSLSHQDAFRWSGSGPLEDLGTLDDGSHTTLGSMAMGINNSGQIAGDSWINNQYIHAFLYSGGAMNDIGTLAAQHSSQAMGLNNLGDVVGHDWNTIGTYVHKAFLYDGKTMTDLNTMLVPGTNWTLSFAYAINDRRQIVGYGTNPYNQTHAFLLTPIDQQSAGISGTGQQTASTGGGSSSPGGLAASFSNVTVPGTLDVESAPADVGAMLNGTGPFGAGAINFAIPSGANSVQVWDVTYSGAFAGPVSLTFTYDPMGLSTADQQALQIYHYTGGQWVALSGAIDLDAHTITVSTDSFSPFALGVPEPASLSLLALGALSMMRRRRSN